MVFRPESFWFWARGDPFLNPRTKIWIQDLEIGLRLARGGFGRENGGWKNMVLWRNGFENGDWGKSRDPNGLYGTQEAFGKASFPQNPFLKMVFPTFPGFREIGEGSPWPPVDLLLALCGAHRGWWHGRRPIESIHSMVL